MHRTYIHMQNKKEREKGEVSEMTFKTDKKVLAEVLRKAEEALGGSAGWWWREDTQPVPVLM